MLMEARIWLSDVMIVLWGFSIFPHIFHPCFWNQTKNQDTWFDISVYLLIQTLGVRKLKTFIEYILYIIYYYF